MEPGLFWCLCICGLCHAQKVSLSSLGARICYKHSRVVRKEPELTWRHQADDFATLLSLSMRLRARASPQQPLQVLM